MILQVSQGAQAACREGEDYKICTEEWILALMEEQGLQGEVEAGLEREEFHLYLQFYVDSGQADYRRSGTVTLGASGQRISFARTVCSLDGERGPYQPP